MTDINEQETTDQSGNEADLRAELEKVKAKNAELIKEKQKAKQKAQEAEAIADEAATQAAERSGDMEALKAAHARELKKYQDKAAATDAELRTIRVDNEINNAYAAAGIPDLSEQFTGWLKGKVDPEIVNGTATIEGVPIREYVESYIASEKGAYFRRAANSSGVGSTGNSATTTNNIAWSKPPQTPEEHYQLARLSTEDPKAYNAAMDRFGTPDRKV